MSAPSSASTHSALRFAVVELSGECVVWNDFEKVQIEAVCSTS